MNDENDKNKPWGSIRIAGALPKPKPDQAELDPDPPHPLLDSMSRYPGLDAGDPEARAAWEYERVQGLPKRMRKRFENLVSANGRDTAMRWLEDEVALDPSLAEHTAFISTGVEPVSAAAGVRQTHLRKQAILSVIRDSGLDPPQIPDQREIREAQRSETRCEGAL